jgi:hypothetical protein
MSRCYRHNIFEVIFKLNTPTYSRLYPRSPMITDGPPEMPRDRRCLCLMAQPPRYDVERWPGVCMVHVWFPFFSGWRSEPPSGYLSGAALWALWGTTSTSPPGSGPTGMPVCHSVGIPTIPFPHSLVYFLVYQFSYYCIFWRFDKCIAINPKLAFFLFVTIHQTPQKFTF